MNIRAWTALVVVSMATPALASGPADTAPTAPVSGEVAYLITKTRWAGTYRIFGFTYEADLDSRGLRTNGALLSLRFHPGGGPAGSCEIIGPGGTFRGIYKMEHGRLVICSTLLPTDPRPRTFAVTSRSDLFILKPAPGK